MDITKMKEKADQLLKSSEVLNEIREETINKYREFRQVCDELTPLITNVVNLKREDLISEFKDYFTGNGFAVTEVGKGNYKAVYQNVEVNFTDDNNGNIDGEAYFGLTIKSEDIYTAVVIRAESARSDMLYLKKHLKYNDNYIELKTAEETILSISDKNILEKLVSDIEVNINWYKETIRDFDNIRFIYSIYKTEKEFDTFKQLFENL